MLGSTFVFINRTSGDETITLQFSTCTLFAKSGSSTITKGLKVTNTAVFLTGKVSTAGVVYYEYAAFAEKSSVPSFDPKVTPFNPWTVDPN